MVHRIALLALLAVLSAGSAAPGLAQQDPDAGPANLDAGTSALWVEFYDNKAYVSNPDDGTIVVIDMETRQIVDTFEAVEGISVLDIADDKGIIYATVFGMSPVFMYDVDTGEALGQISVGDEEVTMFSTSDQPYGQREYVTFNTDTTGIEYNENTGMLYAVQTTLDSVVVIDTETNQRTAEIKVGQGPLIIALDESRNSGYVTNLESGTVSIIDFNTNTVTGSLQTGFAANQMSIDSASDVLYVSHQASPHVTAVDLSTQEILKKIQLDGPTHAVELDEDNSILHVTYLPESALTGAGASGKVEFISARTNEVVGGVELPENPYTISIHGDTQTLLATILNKGTVILVDLGLDSDYQALVSRVAAEEPATLTPGGGCLIATAAYGTEMAPQVQMLRELRDGVMSTESGGAFMSGFHDIYYSFSPYVADLEREHPAFREAVRAAITPMVYSLGIMSLADGGSEGQVLGLGLSVIALNIGMYVAAPALIGVAAYRRARY